MIWVFGDSFSESFNMRHTWVSEYVKYKGYVPKVYAEILSKELNLPYKNLSQGGTDNYTIFENICKNIEQIQPSDFLIIGWSDVVRFRLVNKRNKWKSILPHYDMDLLLTENIEKNSINEILVNRTNELYQKEIDNWIKLINKSLENVDIVHWSPPFGGQNFKCLKFDEKIETIKEETNNKLNNNHYSEKGHKQLAEIFKKYYTKKIVKKLH